MSILLKIEYVINNHLDGRFDCQVELGVGLANLRIFHFYHRHELFPNALKGSSRVVLG